MRADFPIHVARGLTPRAADTRNHRTCGLVLAVLAAGLSPAAQTTGLKIVVIEGENAVNIIQQKTAVRPVVEVRDHNDLPVSGATVTFAIMGSRTATFASGAQSVSLTTNAAGRAAVSALNPLSSGTVRIQIQAAFQGQTATATIAQTNVMTAAQAVQATTATSSGGAGGSGTAGGATAGAGGGGLSTTTLAIVGAAAAGGAVLAREVAGGDSDEFKTYSGPFSGLHVWDLRVCFRTIMHTGTVRMDITAASDGTVTGTGDVAQTRTVTQENCGGGFPVGYSEMDGCCNPSPQVRGTTANLGFNGSHPGGGGTFWTYDFSGALSGAGITGTFTLTVQSPTSPTIVAAFPVSLR